MRICLVLEGCYPYVFGGVSTWMHQYINQMQEHEFVLWVIGANAEKRGKFVYELPENVVEVHEVFLDDALQVKEKGKMSHIFSEKELESLSELMQMRSPDWETLFSLYHDKHLNPMAFLKSETFLDLLIKICKEQYPYIAFADAFHTMRSMLLPVLYLMGSEVPEADVYHAICTGYGGLLACLGGYVHKKDVLLTEHGIYTRAREEEIIRAKWVVPSFKKQWIAFFYMLSDMIYQRAFRVTCLFTNAMRTQIQMGCAPGKCRVIENGIDYDRLSGIPLKEEDGWVDIGAVVRLAPIKDIKTMIYAFFELSAHVKNVRLHIMGGVDDEICTGVLRAGETAEAGKHYIYRACGHCKIYGETGFYHPYQHFRRTTPVCAGILCCKTSLCYHRCRLLSGTSGRKGRGCIWKGRLLCGTYVS